MYAHELFGAGQPNIVVTYPGRFQPFHKGHAGVFKRLVKEFGRDNVYILTSNDSSDLKSPFNFSDKYQLITAAGIPGDRIIETNKMYSLPEGIDPTRTIFVAAVGAPDANRLRPDTFLKRDRKDAEGNIIKPAGSPGYYKTWGSAEKPLTADQHGYVMVVPEIKARVTLNGQTFDVSHGTEVRKVWNLVRNNEKARNEFLKDLYGKATPELVHIFNKIQDAANEDVSLDSSTSTSPIHGGQVYEEAAGVGVIAKNKKMAKDPRYSTSMTVDVHPDTPQKNLKAFRLAEVDEDFGEFDSAVTQLKESKEEPQLPELLAKFLPMAMKTLKLNNLPKINLEKHVETHDGQATFGRYVNDENLIHLAIADRHPLDILRTLAHELCHYKQDTLQELTTGSGRTGSPEENEAHVMAGIIMRHFNKAYPEMIKLNPIDMV